MRSTYILAVGLVLSACSPNSHAAEPWVKPATATVTCERFASVPTERGILYNNVWNAGAAGSFQWGQCIEQKPESKDIKGWSWHWPNSGSQIFAYPQIKVGSSPWDPLPKLDKRFPVRLDSLKSLVISHEIDAQAQGEHNVATTLWLTSTDQIGDSPNRKIIVGEVMFWTYATPGHMSPAGRQVATIEEGGQRWSVWVSEHWGDASGQNDNRWAYVTFKRDAGGFKASFDAVDLLRNKAIAHLGLSSSYVADVELGSEIMRGDGLIWVRVFDVEMVPK